VKVLILNSDSPQNRGDRAILSGLVELVQDLYPNAEITSLSQFQKRDENWFGIKFLPFSPYSTSPIDYLKLLAAARKSDVVLWGGGELLKDYTNKLSLFYWALKLWGVKMVNRKVIGSFQGIGPTNAEISKKMIVAAVNQCQSFLVRDHESKQKLESWGAKSKVVASFDPAVYTSRNFAANPQGPIGLGLRRWFHYRPSGWIPTKYRFWQKDLGPNAQEIRYVENLAVLADQLIETNDADLKFFPMHLGHSEDDGGFADLVISKMKHGHRCSVLASDDISPVDYLTEISNCRMFVASRLHSAILATVANVPSICLYYVDKGRLFFEQLGLSHYSLSITEMQNDGVVEKLMSLSKELTAESEGVIAQQRSSLEAMKGQLKTDLAAAISGLK
jgi:polysaccharide pyruvyl transferase WcaK-like protein